MSIAHKTVFGWTKNYFVTQPNVSSFRIHLLHRNPVATFNTVQIWFFARQIEFQRNPYYEPMRTSYQVRKLLWIVRAANQFRIQWLNAKRNPSANLKFVYFVIHLQTFSLTNHKFGQFEASVPLQLVQFSRFNIGNIE